MKRELIAAIIVPTLGTAAFAQEVLPISGPVQVITPQVVYANPPIRGGYQSRAITTVYDNLSNALANGTGNLALGNCNQALEDVSFTNSPWALPYSGPRVISGCTFALFALGTTPNPSTDREFLVFWDPADVDYHGFSGPGTNMIRPGATPLGAYIFAISGIGTPAGQIHVTGLNVTLPSAANSVFVQVGWLSPAAGVPADWSNLSGLLDESCPNINNRGLVFASNSLASPGGNPATIGTTLPDFGRDILSGAFTSSPGACSDAGIFIGSANAPSTGGQNEHRQLLNASTGVQTQYGYQLLLEGDVAPPACDPDVNQDGATDQGDVDYLIIVIAGGPNPTNINPDFNQDGASDQGDIDALINVIAGGPCP
ncbi:MAG: hypothetical protein GC200_11155 [Tepidisphaera sp.]|nr:hypothetical protein [Tepidisphaera sp.]